MPERAPWFPADWPAPRRIRAGFTNSYANSKDDNPSGFNLALHTGDDPLRVELNRKLLCATLQLPDEPRWLRQVHGNRILKLETETADNQADGCHTDLPGKVCAVLTADCIPLLLCDSSGSEIAAVHAGWRGLCNGVIGQALSYFKCGPARIMAWVGPHICPRHYEVGVEVRDRCLAVFGANAQAAFTDTKPDHFEADLGLLAGLALAACGVTKLYCNELCTYERADLLFSHRRDRNAGRFASLIWIAPE